MIVGRLWGSTRDMGNEQLTTAREMVAASTIGEEAIVADTMETVREDVQQKAADELIDCERHRLGLPVCSVVLPGEANLAVGEREQPAVGDGDAMGVAAEISQHLFRGRRTVAGVDHPVEATQFTDTAGESLAARQGWRGCRRTAACLPRRHSPILAQEQPAEQSRKHPHGQEKDPMGRAARTVAPSSLQRINGAPMLQLNDLSRSLVILEQDATLIAVIEMGQSNWLVAGIVPGVERSPLKKLAVDESALLKLRNCSIAGGRKRRKQVERIAIAFEAGRDGFWLARWLRARGIEAYVIHCISWNSI